MDQLVILVVAAAWVAVLIPPLVRSRVENRPNSSVTDFRRQLNRLQTNTAPRGPVRYMGRPLASSSPMPRQAAGGRPGQGPSRQPTLQRQPRDHRVARGGAPSQRQAQRHEQPEAPRYRTHGDPTGPQRRPGHDPRADHRGAVRRQQPQQHRHAVAERRRPMQYGQPAHRGSESVEVKRRRTNVLFMLVVATACTMFLAATTSSTAMLYLFALSFLGLCGYVYLLAQIREREGGGWSNEGWLEQH